MFTFKSATDMICHIMDHPKISNIIAIFPEENQVLYGKHNIHDGSLTLLFDRLTFNTCADIENDGVRKNRVKREIFDVMQESRPLYFSKRIERNGRVFYVFIPNVIANYTILHNVLYVPDYMYGEYMLEKFTGKYYGNLTDVPCFHFETVFENISDNEHYNNGRLIADFEIPILWLRGILNSLRVSGRIDEDRYLEVRSKMYASTENTIKEIKSRYETAVQVANALSFTDSEKLLKEIGDVEI